MSQATELASDKKETLERMLSAGGKITIHVDGRHPDVAVPPKFVGDPDIVLSLIEMRCVLDEIGIGARLDFSAGPFVCCVPWDALTAAFCEATSECAVWNHEALHIIPDSPRRPALVLLRGGLA